MYYSLEPERSSSRCVTDYPALDVSFLDGNGIDEGALELPIRVGASFDADNPPAHYESGVIPLVSRRLLEALLASGADNVQAFAAVIVGEDGTEWHDYVALQVLGRIACADLDASEYTEIGPGDGEAVPPLIMADELRIDVERVPPGVRLFRLAEQPSTLLASDAFVDALAERGPEGGWGLRAFEVSD